MSSLVFDLETTGLEIDSTIHCLCIHDTRSGEDTTYNDTGNSPSITTGVTHLDDSSCWLVGHNVVGFDLPVIQNRYPFLNGNGRTIDTLILSRLCYPDILDRDAKTNKIPKWLRGRHSLESWGYRLNCLKGDYNNEQTDWSKWTPELEDYCRQDVLLTLKLYNHFQKVLAGLP
jgi:DNA polymerase III epsilon subunit-like protein